MFHFFGPPQGTVRNRNANCRNQQGRDCDVLGGITMDEWQLVRTKEMYNERLRQKAFEEPMCPECVYRSFRRVAPNVEIIPVDYERADVKDGRGGP